MSEAVRQPLPPAPLVSHSINGPASAATAPLPREILVTPQPRPPVAREPQLQTDSRVAHEDNNSESEDEVTSSGSDADSDGSGGDSDGSDSSEAPPVPPATRAQVHSNARILSVTPATRTTRLPAQVAQRNAELTRQQQTLATARHQTARERLAIENPCQFLMVGNKTVEQSLGWRFHESVLENLKPTIVAQDMGSAAIGSKGANQGRGAGMAETILSVGSNSATSAIGSDNDYNIEPRFMTSQHLSSSLLIPADRQRQNTRSIFEVHQKDSHIWRILIETKAPRGMRYYYEAWVKWRPMSGPATIQDRFHTLAIFQSQKPQLSLPAHCGSAITEKERRQTVREQIFYRLATVRTKNFPALVGAYRFWFTIHQCTLNNLIANKSHLRHLLEETPNAMTLTMGDFILLFENDATAAAASTRSNSGNTSTTGKGSASAVAALASSVTTSKRNKDASERTFVRYWLRKMHYSPKLNYLFPGRCPVGFLTKAPYLLTWDDMRPSNSSHHYSFIKDYKEIANWVTPFDPNNQTAFFTPIDLANLGFSFEAELAHERQDFTLDIFRVMASRGHWNYESLFILLDFTPEVIQQLGLTKADLTVHLKWQPPDTIDKSKSSLLDLYNRGRCMGHELFTQEMYEDLPGDEQDVAIAQLLVVVGSSRKSSPKRKRKKKEKEKSKSKHSKKKRKDKH